METGRYLMLLPSSQQHNQKCDKTGRRFRDMLSQRLSAPERNGAPECNDSTNSFPRLVPISNILIKYVILNPTALTLSR